MKKCLGAGWLVVLALPATASAWDVNYNLNPSWTFNGFKGSPGGGNCGPGGCGPCGDCAAPCGAGPCHCMPWYLYWPYECHFQAPAPTKYPFWPPPMTAGPVAYPFPVPPPALPAGPPLPPPPGLLPKPLAGAPQMPAPPVQPIGYYPQMQQVPSYWYGR